MSISDQLLAAFVLYGLPVLFGVILIGSVGIPVPGTFLLIAAGSFVAQGEMNLWWVILLASIGAVLGDQIGHWGGRRLVLKVSGWLGGADRLHDAEVLTKKWGGFSIFLSRWLITILGPCLTHQRYYDVLVSPFFVLGYCRRGAVGYPVRNGRKNVQRPH
jgi:membrane-associated protein